MPWNPNDLGWEKAAESERFIWWMRQRGGGPSYDLDKRTKKSQKKIGTGYVAQSRSSAVGIAERAANEARSKGS